MSERIRRLGWGLVALGVLCFASTRAAAEPPVRGIGVPTVLSIYDHARRLDRDGASSDAERGGDDHPPLETIDTVVLDPGHGADNSGAIGAEQTAEKYLTLELAYALRERLQRRHPELRVRLTRYWDESVSLDERTHFANRTDADLFLSLHYNAATHQRAVGVETYFLADRKATSGRHRVGREFGSPGLRDRRQESTDARWREDRNDETEPFHRRRKLVDAHTGSRQLAQLAQKQMVDHIDTVDRGVKQANFGVLREAQMPAAVIEAGFMSHPEEGRRLMSKAHRQKVVRALADAVLVFDWRRLENREEER